MKRPGIQKKQNEIQFRCDPIAPDEFAFCEIVVNKEYKFNMVTDGQKEKILKRAKKKTYSYINIKSVDVKTLKKWKKNKQLPCF